MDNFRMSEECRIRMLVVSSNCIECKASGGSQVKKFHLVPPAPCDRTVEASNFGRDLRSPRKFDTSNGRGHKFPAASLVLLHIVSAEGG